MNFRFRNANDSFRYLNQLMAAYCATTQKIQTVEGKRVTHLNKLPTSALIEIDISGAASKVIGTAGQLSEAIRVVKATTQCCNMDPLESDMLTMMSSRNGNVICFTEPVTITFTRSNERVLFHEGRDCNPFFHLFESLWMLSGQNDVKLLTYFNSKMDQYSDDGNTLNGAYGHRWRRFFGVDQIHQVVEMLDRNPYDRRAVLQHWSTEDLKLVNHTRGSCRDVPCNTQVMFRVRIDTGHLDMTVINRSNDLIWGLLGANYVHFGHLHQYVADALGWKVGKYHQVSNNLHVYLESWKPETFLVPIIDPYLSVTEINGTPQSSLLPDITHMQEFEMEVQGYMEIAQRMTLYRKDPDPAAPDWHQLVWSHIEGHYNTRCILELFGPMLLAWELYKRRNYEMSYQYLNRISPRFADWKRDLYRWIQKRHEAHESKRRGTRKDPLNS